MILNNVELNWTSVKQPDGMSGKYQTEFYFTDKEAEKQFVEQINKAWEEYKGNYKGQPQSLGYVEKDGRLKFKATQAPQSADGKYTFEVGVYDAKARKLEGDKIPNIGNGTIANLDVEIYPYTFKNQKGVKLTLRNVQILDLKEYSNEPAFAPTDGYTAEETPFDANQAQPEVEGV